jgi:DNA-binding transcriptional MerR regulator
MADEKALLKIGELATRTQKTVRALHLYEELGLLRPASRTASGYRMYDDGNMERIHYISRLQRLGMSLSDIGSLLEELDAEDAPRDAMARLRTVYTDRLANVRSQMADLKNLESELLASLGYLAGCAGCQHTREAPTACASCIEVERAGEETPTLITGLLAH